MGFSVRGHICIRRKAKDGDPGEAGKSIRTTVWETGKQFYAGDTQVDGVYPLDIVADKAISIGVSGVNFYMCRTSHTSSANIPLTNTAYWTKLNNLKPVVTYLILAELIKANYIDVQDLAANNAFINNLYVKHLSGADGDFSGTVTAQQGEITGTLKIGEDGELSTDAQLGSTHNRVKLDNDGIKFSSSDSVHGSTSHDTELKKTGLSIGYIRHYTGVNIDGEMNIGYGAITRTDNIEQETEYALFANGSYRLAIVSSLPSTTDSSTIYIVTGTSKGVYVGSSKIA